MAASLGTAPATRAHRGTRTWLRPFANSLARKLSASLVSWAAGDVVCPRAARGGGCGAATGGRSSTWVRVRVRVRVRLLLQGPAAAAPAPARGGVCLPRAAQVPFPRSGELHHSGNDDSGKIVQALAFLSSPSAPCLLVISQLISACPGTVRKREVNEGHLKLTSLVCCQRNRRPQPYLYLSTVHLNLSGVIDPLLCARGQVLWERKRYLTKNMAVLPRAIFICHRELVLRLDPCTVQGKIKVAPSSK